MPELPEVETIARGLAGLVGERIARVDVYWPRIIEQPVAGEFIALSRGRLFVRVWRRAKFLVLQLDQGAIVVHLRMTGQLYWRESQMEQPCDRHVHLSFSLGSGRVLDYRDVRKFGRVWLVDDPQNVLDHLGPEPLDSDLDEACFHRMVSGRRRILKALLLDQHFIAGLGNIYVDESLYRARIAPSRIANTLAPKESARLLRAIRNVLQEAILARGTTLRDYRDSDGQRGENQYQLCVYGKQGSSCPLCGTTIVKQIVAGRGTHFCPMCQPDLEFREVTRGG